MTVGVMALMLIPLYSLLRFVTLSFGTNCTCAVFCTARRLATISPSGGLSWLLPSTLCSDPAIAGHMARLPNRRIMRQQGAERHLLWVCHADVGPVQRSVDTRRWIVW